MPNLRILKRDPLAYTENAFAPNATAFIYFLDGSSINDDRVQIAEKSPFYSALNRCLTPDTEMPEYLSDWDFLPQETQGTSAESADPGTYTGQLFKMGVSSGGMPSGYVPANGFEDATHGRESSVMGFVYRSLTYWGGFEAKPATGTLIPPRLVERVSGFTMTLTASGLQLKLSGDTIGQPLETQSVKTLTDGIKTLATAYRLRDTAPLTIEV
jgi:hypothetical protein